MEAMNLSIGICHRCRLRVPATALDGTPARENFEYKVVHGEPETMWHYEHPLYPNCYHMESKDPNSVWYDDPRSHMGDDPLADDDEGDESLYLAPALQDDLPDYLSKTSVYRKIHVRGRELGFGDQS